MTDEAFDQFQSELPSIIFAWQLDKALKALKDAIEEDMQESHYTRACTM
jgi:hypothetical protein